MKIEIAISKSYLSALSKIPKSTQKKANEFFEKFKNNPDAASINYESIAISKDDKVRTVRIDQKYRAIVIHPSEGNIYLFVHIDTHDEAMNWARNKVFDINEYSSAIQIVDLSIDDQNKKNYTNKGSTSSSEKTRLSKYSDNELISIGIPKVILPVLSMVKTIEDLNKYVKDYVSDDIYEILEFCLEGIPINEIKDCFSIEKTEKKQTLQEVVKKEINQSYVKVISAEESINNILANPIDFWRIFIHPKQLKFVKGNNGIYNGSFQIKGAAGTGKTVVAMHRTKYLAENIYNEEENKILYTTYSKKLTKSVEYNLKNMCNFDSLRRIEVIHLHSWVAKYLRSHKIEFHIINDKTRIKYIKQAIEKIGLQNSFTVEDVINEIDIVLSFYGITDLNSYLKVSRNGTYKKMGRNQRKQIWYIVSEYFEMLFEMNLTEWWILIKDVVSMIQRKKDVEYDAIIIDEAQDFSMPEYRLLRAMAPRKENDLFIVGDIRQKIYSGRINFSMCQINILGNRTRELTINYRNTAEISTLGNKVIERSDFLDLDGTNLVHKRTNCLINGEEPIIQHFYNQSDEAAYVLDEILKIINTGIMYNEIAIVARTNKYLSVLTQYLQEAGINCISLDEVNPLNKNSVYFGTMHSIKGFEFKVVFVIGANKKLLPLNSHLCQLKHERQIQQFIQAERSLLYVSITRARDLVYLISSDTPCEWLSE